MHEDSRSHEQLRLQGVCDGGFQDSEYRVCSAWPSDPGDSAHVSQSDGRQIDWVNEEIAQSDPHYAPSGVLRGLSQASVRWQEGASGEGERGREALHGEAASDAEVVRRLRLSLWRYASRP